MTEGETRGAIFTRGAVDETTVRIVDALFRHFAKQVRSVFTQPGPQPDEVVRGAGSRKSLPCTLARDTQSGTDDGPAHFA
jgi:hypothetical protein